MERSSVSSVSPIRMPPTPGALILPLMLSSLGLDHWLEVSPVKAAFNCNLLSTLININTHVRCYIICEAVNEGSIESSSLFSMFYTSGNFGAFTASKTTNPLNLANPSANVANATNATTASPSTTKNSASGALHSHGKHHTHILFSDCRFRAQCDEDSQFTIPSSEALVTKYCLIN